MLQLREGKGLAQQTRPLRVDEYIGNAKIVQGLFGLLAQPGHPHTISIVGPTGFGKTTLARIAAMSLNCENSPTTGYPCLKCGSCFQISQGVSTLGYDEFNAASERGINEMKELASRFRVGILGRSKFKIWVIDEAHQITKEGQQVLLKATEDIPGHVYVFLCSMESSKLHTALRDRFTEYLLRSLVEKDVEQLIRELLVVTKVVNLEAGLSPQDPEWKFMIDLKARLWDDLRIRTPRRIVKAVEVAVPTRDVSLIRDVDDEEIIEEVWKLASAVREGRWALVQTLFTEYGDLLKTQEYLTSVRIIVLNFLGAALLKNSDHKAARLTNAILKMQTFPTHKAELLAMLHEATHCMAQS